MNPMELARKIAQSPRAARIVKSMWSGLCKDCSEKARLKPSTKVEEYCDKCRPKVLDKMKELQEALR